jgi:IS30 family transposase
MLYHKRGCPRYQQEVLLRLLAMAKDPKVSIGIAANNLGLSQSTVSTMIRIHSIQWVLAGERQLEESRVREALEGRTTLEASQLLDVNHQTLRNQFPHLLQKRASPGILEDHKEQIHSLATKMRAKEIGSQLGVHFDTVRSAIERWKKQEPDVWSDVSAFQRSRPEGGRKPRRTA